jgi:hypothetical protein
MKRYIVQQYIEKDWFIYVVKASSKKNAKKSAILKGANPIKKMSVSLS